MKIGITPFIAENIVPPNINGLAIFDGDKKICDISISQMKPELGEKLYSFGLVSDIHLWHNPAVWNPNEKFDNALTYFEDKECSMCIVTGDLTQTGFYIRTNDSDPSTQYFDESQMTKYKEICDKHEMPIYEIAGNHECYYAMPITDNLDLWETYTGKRELSYSVPCGNDFFIFCGQPSQGAVMSDTDFVWLANTLEANKNKRCFVFVHSYIEEDSGDPMDKRENSIFETWGTANKNAFVNLLVQYPNTILFHGHSHMKFECQEDDKKANYTEANGFKSAHIPSLSRPRNLDMDSTDKPTPYADSESQGYIVDVYDDCIVLNGMDFINNKPVPLGTFKVDV